MRHKTSGYFLLSALLVSLILGLCILLNLRCPQAVSDDALTQEQLTRGVTLTGWQQTGPGHWRFAFEAPADVPELVLCLSTRLLDAVPEGLEPTDQRGEAFWVRPVPGRTSEITVTSTTVPQMWLMLPDTLWHWRELRSSLQLMALVAFASMGAGILALFCFKPQHELGVFLLYLGVMFGWGLAVLLPAGQTGALLGFLMGLYFPFAVLTPIWLCCSLLHVALPRRGSRHFALSVLATLLFLMLGTSLVFTLVGLLFSNQIAAALTNDPELQQLCREYLSVNLVFCWGIFLQTYGQRLLQAVGDTVLSMVSLIIGAVVNIILDPIMIFGLLGCPAMGIRGAAIATVIGQLIGAAAALWFNRVKNPVIHVRLKGYRFLWQDVADIYRVGLPTIVMQAIGSVMTFAVNGILLGVSSAAVAFFGIYYKLQNFLMMPVNGLGQAAIPVVGFNYGSGQSDRVKQAWKVLLPTGVVFALCGTAVFLLFPAQLLGLFSASDEMLAFGVPALRIISVTFLFAVITILCGYFASGLGNGVVNMIGAALRQLVVLVPCLWLLIRTMGIEKAWFAFWVSEVVAYAYSLWATKKELRNKGK